MAEGVFALAYLVAGGLFILSLGGLSRQSTAVRGNLYGMAGMFLALVVTMRHPHAGQSLMTLVAIGLGGLIGLLLARRVAMTEMPQMVAMLHSFVGLAAVLVGLSTYLEPTEVHHGVEALVHTLEVFADVTIGGITFAGSVIAWAKLDERLSGKPLLLPGRHQINLGLLAAMVVLAIPAMYVGGGFGMFCLVLAAVLSCVLGAHLVMAIGGADMPVVVSLLNSYSGWTAAAAGFMLSNDLLIVTGALVGSSGAILSYIMCKAMNRSIWNVVFGGFGTEPEVPPEGAVPETRTAVGIEAAALAQLIEQAQEILIVPGYGMAVARAQNAVKDFVEEMRKRGKRVRFAIHPVAGRLPGHMNVLLAEAGVSYDLVHEMEEINDDFRKADIAIIIGANDIVNPGAQDDPHSPIYGMPVLVAWEAKTCVVLKRGMNFGYAGVSNPLFFHENTRMLFGDAKASMDGLVTALRAG
jgi:NAD(P) transhydrogenase subunit beta